MAKTRSAVILNSNRPLTKHLTSDSYFEIGSNVGNTYITFVMLKVLGGSYRFNFFANNIWRDTESKRTAETAANECNFAILILQDQLRIGNDDNDYECALRNIMLLGEHVKLIVVSLGANAFGEDSRTLVSRLSFAQRQFFDFLATRCVSIGVRGAFTAEVLELMQISNYRIVGCPSYFESGPDRFVEAPDRRLDRPFLGLTGAFRMQGRKDVEHFLQGDTEWPLIELMYTPTPLLRAEIDKGVCPASFEEAMLAAAVEGRAHFCSNFRMWKEIVSRDCRLICGTRLHGAIIALNANVPAIVTSGDARARETCELFGIPYYPEFNGRDVTDDELMQAANPETLNDLYKLRRQSFVDWLIETGLEVVPAKDEPELLSYERVPAERIVERARALASMR